jgi:hypothetical protein
MLGLPVLILALLLSGPALWSGFVTGDLDSTDALIRFLIAVPVSGGAIALLRSLTSGYTAAAQKRERDAARAAKLAARKAADAGKPHAVG